MRIGVVNDLHSALHVLCKAIEAGGHEVAWKALDGAEAVSRCRADRPDVVLMDLIMPVMDGVEATRRIMAEAPCPILVVTATVTGNATRVYEALGAGALDAVDTPTLAPDGSVVGADRMLRRIDQVRQLAAEPHRALRVEAEPPPPISAPRSEGSSDLPPVLAIGASTGGPQALAVLLRGLPRPLRHAVLIVQHIGAPFVEGLADWLGRECSCPIATARDGEAIVPGRVVLGTGDRHLIADRQGRIRCPEEPSELLHRPSVDVLFGSLASGPCRGVAVLLTGMGRDGATGLLELRGRGWWTIAQDRETSVVWGMPGTAVREGAACEALPIDAIAASAAKHLARVAGGSA
ncbi:MAG: chemotaxis-specific protein-glutamate methyltransferase CheB [Phycisphaerales bacterium]|nr:chemotaxis-specific protein-glutamate methyltransferase CheB [Phycisphaerales bacterium]